MLGCMKGWMFDKTTSLFSLYWSLAQIFNVNGVSKEQEQILLRSFSVFTPNKLDIYI